MVCLVGDPVTGGFCCDIPGYLSTATFLFHFNLYNIILDSFQVVRSIFLAECSIKEGRTQYRQIDGCQCSVL